VTYAASTECNGALSTVVSGLTCNVAFATLNAAPYNLAWGSGVYAIVQATNAVGGSAYSTAGNGGAIILTTPSAPQTLSNNPLVTTTN
jgi:hypothetical protein